MGKDIAPLKDAYSIDELKTLDVILTCQGGDYLAKYSQACARPAGRATGSMPPPVCAWKTTR
ncbi:hypothetical protein P4233_19125 [Pseudomonas aeruginosa]|nr:hypothetical protein [Pseudomonas aeruginosa]